MDLLQNIFCPLVGAVSSPEADDICQKNNLSFVELLQPFSKINSATNIGKFLKLHLSPEWLILLATRLLQIDTVLTTHPHVTSHDLKSPSPFQDRALTKVPEILCSVTPKAPVSL